MNTTMMGQTVAMLAYFSIRMMVYAVILEKK